MSTTEMQTVEIEWTGVSCHRTTVNVPPGFDRERSDLADALAALSDARFVGVEREGISVRAVAHDAAAPRFDPV